MIVFFFVVAFFLLVVLMKSIKIVPQKQVKIIERLGIGCLAVLDDEEKLRRGQHHL